MSHSRKTVMKDQLAKALQVKAKQMREMIPEAVQDGLGQVGEQEQLRELRLENIDMKNGADFFGKLAVELNEDQMTAFLMLIPEAMEELSKILKNPLKTDHKLTISRDDVLQFAGPAWADAIVKQFEAIGDRSDISEYVTQFQHVYETEVDKVYNDCAEKKPGRDSGTSWVSGR